MELVAFLGEDKENWGQISALLNRMELDRAVIIKNKEVSEFSVNDNCDIISVNSNQSLLELKKEIIDKLKPKISGDFEVALSIASGTGKEHMALISALLCIPVGIKLVVFTKNGVEFIS